MAGLSWIGTELDGYADTESALDVTKQMSW